MRAYQAIKRFDPERPFVNWLLTIASRYCIDQLRRRRLQTAPIDDLLERGLPDSALGPEATLSRVDCRWATALINQIAALSCFLR